MGENNGTVENCSFTGNLSGKENTGGIAGINGTTGIIRACKTSGAVFGDVRTGGVAGYNLGVIESCENQACVNITSVDPSIDLEDIEFEFVLDLARLTALDTTSAPSDTGGIAGYSSGILRSCTNSNTIGYPHIGYNTGGIAGRSSGYVTDCSNEAAVYGRKDVGGIAGQMEPYINLELSPDTLSMLQDQLNTLNEMIAAALSDGDAGVDAIADRLNNIADYAENAADAVETIQTYGSVTTDITGNGEAESEGSASVTFPQYEISGSGESGGSSSVKLAPDGSSGAADSYAKGSMQSGLSEGSAAGNSSASASGQISAVMQIELNTSLQGLSAAVSGMTGQMRLLNGEVSETSGILTEDMQSISDQVNAIGNTFFNALLNTEETDILEDASLTAVDQITLGKISESENRGEVQGDINVGGISGAMAIEYELDPEDDVTGSISGVQRRKYELKVVIQSCTNTGAVTAKKSYAGGISGRMDLGLITQAENYGELKSESGDYIGGIAGITGGTVRNCFSKCTLQGGSYVGGIVGSGVEENVGGASSMVSGCYAFVNILECEQYAGAISGINTGTFLENYFISEDLAGINRQSYSGRAEPISFAALSELKNLSDDGEQSEAVKIPQAFQNLTLQFVAEDQILKEFSFEYGASFDESVYPEIPEKEGCVAYWDQTELINLCFDTVVSVVYEPYTTALASNFLRSNDRPVFLIEGQFNSESLLKANQAIWSEEDAAIRPKDLWSAFRNCFEQDDLDAEILECWEVHIPDDGLQVHTLRYLPPEGEGNLIVYTKQENQWVRTDAEMRGSCLLFTVEGYAAEIMVVSAYSAGWIRLLCAGIVLLLLSMVIRILRKHGRNPRKKSGVKAQHLKTDRDKAKKRAASFQNMACRTALCHRYRGA